jgi:hypothetical protein
MSGSMPWTSATPQLQSNDPNAVLQRIDRNLTSLVTLVKVVLVLVVVLGVVTIFI